MLALLAFSLLLIFEKNNFLEIALSNPIYFLPTAKDEDPESQTNQAKRLQGLKNSLKKHEINLEIEYSVTLHDREIRFNNGWTIKIGRGLDYFKPPPGKFCIGFCDFNLRECHETMIDIYLKKG